MAHSDEKRRAVRAAYIFDQLSLEMAALTNEVPFATVRKWKSDDKKAGDDWERARSAQLMAGGSIEDVVRQTLAVVVIQVQATVQAIQDTPDMSPTIKVDMLASLADAYNKLIAASRRMMPETDKLAVASDVLKRQAEFIRLNYPQHQSAFADILSAFGEELTKVF